MALDNIGKNGDAAGMTYPGGKNGEGTYQRIINLMPPHETYIEPFLGSGAILRMKRPAARNIGLDLDREVIAAWRATQLDRPSAKVARPDPRATEMRSQNRKLLPSLKLPGGPGHFEFAETDAIGYLISKQLSARDLVYCDPPYPHSTRGRADLYRHEMSDAQHRELLDVLLNLDCMVMISGYWCPLYAEMLRGWNSIHYEAMTRAGHTATEWLWFNFPVPVALHDYSYLGENFRERERIKRKKLRWANRLKRMPLLEKRALLAAIEAAA